MKMSTAVSVAVMVAVVALTCVSGTSADTFGTGGNQFTIDFVPILGDTGDLDSWPAGSGYTFTGANRDDYRMGTLEIANDQWDKFQAELDVPVTGTPSSAYDEDPYWMGTNVPTNDVSWYEAAQFVNWLNTSKGYQPAYKFTGTQGQSDYALDTWSTGEADGTNLYRHKDAFYYMPTEDEWVKAAYWNGTTLQTHATKPGETLHQGDGTSGTGWNYYDGEWATDPYGPWDVGSGSEELNATFDMMGNVWEWLESPESSYGTDSFRMLRGGAYGHVGALASSERVWGSPTLQFDFIGFRVASEVPEPSSLVLLSLGALAALRQGR